MLRTGKLHEGNIGRAVEDSNPRHQVLETCVLPTELTAQGDEPLSQRCWQLIERGRNLSDRSAASRGWPYPPVPADRKASPCALYRAVPPLWKPLEGYEP